MLDGEEGRVQIGRRATAGPKSQHKFLGAFLQAGTLT